MKFWVKSYEHHPVFVTGLIFVVSLLGFAFRFEHGPAFIHPALGIGFVLAYTFGRKVYAGIASGIILAHIVMRLFVWQALVLHSLSMSVFTAFLILLQIHMALYLTKKYKLDLLFNGFNWVLLGKVFLTVVVVSLTGAIMGTTLYVLVYEPSISWALIGSIHFIGDYFAFVLFVPVGILSYRVDRELFDIATWKIIAVRLGLVSVFAGLLILLAYEVSYFSFDKDYYIVLAFYAVIGFAFSYRMIGYFTVIFLLISAFHIGGLASGEWMASALNINVFLMIGTGLAITIKRFNDVRYAQRDQIEESNRHNVTILDDVHNLLHFSRDVVRQPDNEQEYLEKTLHVAMRQLKEIDYGYCYIETSGTITLVNSVGYDDDVPFVYESHDLLEKSDHNLFYTQNILRTFREMYGEQYGLLQSRKETERRRLLMRFDLGKNRSFIVSIGKHKRRDIFTNRQLDHMEHFMKLIRSLFKRNYYLTQNTQMKHEIVLSFIRTLELYDPYTKGHSEDVAFFVTEIAKKLDLDDAQFDTLYWAGILHDIGKVGVSNRILNKPSKLTKEEYDDVKEHVNYGYDVLYPSEDLNTIAKIVRHHHEWWNGQGYPDGLKEQEIPLGSQIIGVADMVSTMATNRTYRAKQSKNRIVKELKKYRGVQFSPRVVDSMLELLDQGLLEKHYTLT